MKLLNLFKRKTWIAAKAHWQFMEHVRHASAKQKENPQAAIAHYEDALQLASQLQFPSAKEEIANAYFQKATVHLFLFEHENTLNAINEAIKLTTHSARFFNMRGSIYLDQEQFELADADFQQAIELKQADLHIHYTNLGHSQLLQQKFEEAIQLFDQALKLQPSYTSAMYYSALYHLEFGNYEKALTQYNRALSNKEGNFYKTVKLLVFLQGEERFTKQFILPSLVHPKNIERLRQNTSILNQIKQIAYYTTKGNACIKQEHYQKAIDYYQKTLSIHSSLRYLYFCLGYCESQLGNYKKSNGYLSRAESLGYKDAREVINNNWMNNVSDLLLKAGATFE